jgi:ABC-type nitrate/sulfonate/bicarbonate transport system substrate-binding protein
MPSSFSMSASRRQVLLGAAGLSMALCSRPAAAQALAPVTTALGWIPNAEYAGLWVGIEKGYFAEGGIDIKYTPGGPNAPGVLVSLAAGKADYAGADWMPFLETVEKGNDFVVLGAAFPTSPAAILSLAKRPVLEPKDLVGARILTQMPADKNTVDYILTKAGLPLDYTLVPTGFSPEPLLAGDGDAYFAFATNQPITLETMGMKEGVDFHVTLMDTLGYKTPAGIIVAKKSYVAENRPLVVAYLKALIRGWRENAKDPKVAAQLIIDKYGADYGLELKQQIRQNELGIPLIETAGSRGPFWFDPAVVQSTIAEIAKSAGHAKMPATADIVDLSPLEDAIASL